jgi:hypothetical protein
VAVAGEAGEPVGVGPDPLVGGVKEVGAVAVDLDAGGRVGLAVRIAAEVVAALDHLHLQPVLCELLGHGEAEEARPDDEDVRHRRHPSRAGTASAATSCPPRSSVRP